MFYYMTMFINKLENKSYKIADLLEHNKQINLQDKKLLQYKTYEREL